MTFMSHHTKVLLQTYSALCSQLQWDHSFTVEAKILSGSLVIGCTTFSFTTKALSKKLVFESSRRLVKYYFFFYSVLCNYNLNSLCKCCCFVNSTQLFLVRLYYHCTCTCVMNELVSTFTPSYL